MISYTVCYSIGRIRRFSSPSGSWAFKAFTALVIYGLFIYSRAASLCALIIFVLPSIQ